MPVALLILLSTSLTYIETNDCSPMEPSRTPYGIILLFWVGRNCKYRNLTAPYCGCNYILNCNVITQSQETTLLRFIFRMNVRYISYLVQMLFSLPRTVMLAVLTSNFSGAFFRLTIGYGARHRVYVHNFDGKLFSISVIPVIV